MTTIVKTIDQTNNEPDAAFRAKLNDNFKALAAGVNAGVTGPTGPTGATGPTGPGAAQAAGTFTALTGGGPVTVADTNVTANSVIIITLKTVGGTVGSPPIIKTISAGTGFTVNNTASDTSVYNYRIIG